MRSMTILGQSERTTLRRLCPTDLDAFLAYRGDPIVALYQSWAPMSRETALGFLAACETAPLFAPGEWCQIAIANAENTLIGDMGLFLSDDSAHAELGITLARPHWGQGHAISAMTMAIDLVWAQSPARAIRAWGDQRNTRSIALMQRLGMTHLGTETSNIVEEAFILHRPKGR